MGHLTHQGRGRGPAALEPAHHDDVVDLAPTASADEARVATEHRDKALATARAKCALQGFVLHAVSGHGGEPELWVSRWGWGRAFQNLRDLDEWLTAVTGSKP